MEHPKRKDTLDKECPFEAESEFRTVYFNNEKISQAAKIRKTIAMPILTAPACLRRNSVNCFEVVP